MVKLLPKDSQEKMNVMWQPDCSEAVPQCQTRQTMKGTFTSSPLQPCLFAASPDEPVPQGDVADHAEQQHTLQHGREPGVQRERVLLGAVQDLQAAPTHGSGAHAAAGLAALPGGDLAALPDAAAAGRLPPCDGLLPGHGVGQQPPPLPLQVGGRSARARLISPLAAHSQFCLLDSVLLSWNHKLFQMVSFVFCRPGQRSTLCSWWTWFWIRRAFATAPLWRTLRPPSSS